MPPPHPAEGSASEEGFQSNPDLASTELAQEKRVDARNDFFVALFFAALGAGMIIYGLISPPPARVNDVIGPYGFGITVGSLILLCAAGIAVRDLLIWRANSPSDKSDPIVGRAADEPEVPASTTRAMLMAAMTLLYAVVLNPIGYIFTTLLYTAGSLWLMNVRSWKLIISTSIGFTVVTFIVFGLGLGVALPLGPLNDLFIDLGIVDAVR